MSLLQIIVLVSLEALNVTIAAYVAMRRAHEPAPYVVAAAVVTFIPPVLVLLLKEPNPQPPAPQSDEELLREL